MITANVKVNLTALAKLEKDADKLTKKVVRVGVLHPVKDHNTTTDVIAAANEREYGWITGIGTFVPPRSTIRLPVETKEKEIARAGTDALTDFEEETIDKALNAMGDRALEAIQEAFDTQGFGQWQDNAPSVQKRKGRNEPMVDTGVLRQNYSKEIVENG